MFSKAVRVVRELQPKAFIFPNAKGLMRETFATYFEYVVLRLAHPVWFVAKTKLGKIDEAWQDHRARPEKSHSAGRTRPEYNIVFRLLNSAN